MSGGFATVQPDSTMSINAVEGYSLEDFSADAIKNQIAEAQKIASGSGSEQDIAEAKVELEVRNLPAVRCVVLTFVGSRDTCCACEIEGISFPILCTNKTVLPSASATAIDTTNCVPN